MESYLWPREQVALNYFSKRQKFWTIGSSPRECGPIQKASKISFFAWLVKLHSLHLAFQIKQGPDSLLRLSWPSAPWLRPLFIPCAVVLPLNGRDVPALVSQSCLVHSCPFVLACLVFLAVISLSFFSGYTNPAPFYPSVRPYIIYPFTEHLLCEKHIHHNYPSITIFTEVS